MDFLSDQNRCFEIHVFMSEKQTLRSSLQFSCRPKELQFYKASDCLKVDVSLKLRVWHAKHRVREKNRSGKKSLNILR
jgi:hypothetical protein